MNLAVYIGRFSPFHNGHEYVVKNAINKYDKLIVLIGSPNASNSKEGRNYKNPFTFSERKSLITNQFNNVSVYPLRDYLYNDTLWIREVQSVIKNAITELGISPRTISIVGSDRDSSTWYLSAFPQYKLDLSEPYGNDISATRIRDEFFLLNKINNVTEETKTFLKDFANRPEFKTTKDEYEFIRSYKDSWKQAPYQPTFVTVDSLVVQSGHLLVIKRGKNPGKGLLALPGGYLNQNEKTQDGAIRELMEETKISLAKGKNSKQITKAILRSSVRESKVFDMPDRDPRGRTITTAFLIRLDDTKPLPIVKGADDAAEAMWLPVDDALDNMNMWFSDHFHIIETLISTKDL